MELKTFFAQDLSGNVIPSPTVTVFQPGTTTRVTGLQTATGAALNNPFNGTTTGQITLAAPDGTYDLAISGGGRAITMRVRFVDVDADSVAAAAASALSASENASGAQADRIAAQAARDAAFVNANVYSTVAAGLAAVADAVQFQVVSSDGVTITRYRRDSAVLATLVASYPAGSLLLSGFQRSGWSYAVADAENNLAIGVRPDGSFAIGGEEDVGAAIPGARLATTNFWGREGGDGYVFGIADSANNLAFAVLADGRVMYAGLELADKPQADLLSAAVFGSKFITCWGDSLTEGSGSTGNQTYPVQLATLTGLPTINEGFGGQVARQIICRQGGAATLVTVAGNLIPASGSVNVTLDVNLLAYPAAQSFSITGTLLGVRGTLTKDTGSSYTFTRLTAGSTVICPPATPFVVTQSTRNTSSRNLDQGINIFWCGSNDVGTATIADVAGFIDLAVAKLQQSEKRFLVLGPIASNAVTSASGGYAPMRAAVAQLRARYPSNFIDIHEVLIENYNPAIPQDVTDYANKVTPSSLRTDTIHLNNAGYAIVANTVFNHLTAKGWL